MSFALEPPVNRVTYLLWVFATPVEKQLGQNKLASSLNRLEENEESLGETRASPFSQLFCLLAEEQILNYPIL